MSKSLALIGNPNVGKTAIFNELTGQTGHVANWPGVTVEKKTGKLDDIQVIDLPGVYSLSPAAIDELIARNFIVNEKPDIIVDILDATNLERNLYLAFLLKELEVPIIFILNLMDAAESRKIDINVEKLSEMLGAPVLPTVAIKGKGINEVKSLIKNIIRDHKLAFKTGYKISYSDKIENKISQTIDLLKLHTPTFLPNLRRWVAIKILEDDKEVIKEISAAGGGLVLMDSLKRSADESLEFDLAGERYEKISKIIKETYQRDESVLTTSDLLDKVFLNKYFGIPIFFMIMWAMFEFTFRASAPLVTLLEVGLGALGDFITMSWPADAWYTSLVVDGLIGGFGAVLGFVPLIFMLYLVLSFLEDSGYLSRAAFVMDRAMNKIGLHGRSFVSMILGFGCNIPAVMSCRAIEDEEDRLTTILVNQNISCGARLPVYVLLGGFVWGTAAGTIIFLLYIIGIAVAILMALFLRKVVFKKTESSPFILELGDYRAPTAKYTGIHMWERGREFIKKAGLIIFTVVVAMWLLLNIGFSSTGLAWGVDSGDSLLAAIGKVFQPIFTPLNWSWIAVAGIIFGFLAKEVVVAMFGLILLGVEEAEGLGAAVVAALPNTALAASAVPYLVFGYLVFVLLYTPCVAHIGAVYKETGSRKWTLFSATYGIVLGYIFALLINLIGGVYF
ncbi:MAG: ferrous iron transport protein B [Candidatus Odinarchaeota archaeon]